VYNRSWICRATPCCILCNDDVEDGLHFTPNDQELIRVLQMVVIKTQVKKRTRLQVVQNGMTMMMEDKKEHGVEHSLLENN
jgi:hypothetical protein